MKQDGVNYGAVGLFVLAALTLLIATLLELSRGHPSAETFYTDFENVTDIREGSRVTFGGFQIGNVSSVEPLRENGQTRFRLKLAIREGWPIPKDSVARITSSGLLSDSEIDIYEGKSDTLLREGEAINSDLPAGVMAAVDAVSSEFQDLSRNNLKPLLESLNQHVNAIGGDLGQTLPKITANLDATLARLTFTVDQVARIAGPQNQAHVNNILANAETATRSLATLANDLGDTNKKLNVVLQRSDTMLVENAEDVRAVLTNLRHTTQTLAAHIESIMFHLESASRNANEFTRQIRSNPSTLISGSPPPDRGAAQ